MPECLLASSTQSDWLQRRSDGQTLNADKTVWTAGGRWRTADLPHTYISENKHRQCKVKWNEMSHNTTAVSSQLIWQYTVNCRAYTQNTECWLVMIVFLSIFCDNILYVSHTFAFSTLTLCWASETASGQWKKWVMMRCWLAGMVICLEQGANDFDMVQLMPLPPHLLFFK